jgi:hypothetical protein
MAKSEIRARWDAARPAGSVPPSLQKVAGELRKRGAAFEIREEADGRFLLKIATDDAFRADQDGILNDAKTLNFL